MTTMGPGGGVLHELEAVLSERLASRPQESYSVRLLTDVEAVQRKIVEEAFELCLELGRAGTDEFSPERVTSEAADLFFHALAGIIGAGVSLDAVLAELARRRGGGRHEPAAPEGRR